MKFLSLKSTVMSWYISCHLCFTVSWTNIGISNYQQSSEIAASWFVQPPLTVTLIHVAEVIWFRIPQAKKNKKKTKFLKTNDKGTQELECLYFPLWAFNRLLYFKLFYILKIYQSQHQRAIKTPFWSVEFTVLYNNTYYIAIHCNIFTIYHNIYCNITNCKICYNTCIAYHDSHGSFTAQHFQSMIELFHYSNFMPWKFHNAFVFIPVHLIIL